VSSSFDNFMAFDTSWDVMFFFDSVNFLNSEIFDIEVLCFIFNVVFALEKELSVFLNFEKELSVFLNFD
jgi:hypothetical protein